MKATRLLLIGVLLIASVLTVAYLLPLQPQTAYAATPLSGAVTAKASSAVTTGTFVKLSAAGAIAPATGLTDKVVGVCEQTQATVGGFTRYAPVGTQATVTSGEAIAVGDLLTTGTGGKAFVLDLDDASDQRICGMALTAASDADESVTIIVVTGYMEASGV